jgi:hypothetical protein
MYGGFVMKVCDVSDPTNPLILTDELINLNIRGWSEPKDLKVQLSEI